MSVSRTNSAFFAVLSLLIIGSCSRIEGPMLQGDSMQGELVTVEATWGDLVETKTEMQPADASGKSAIWWSPGDAINLFYGSSTKAKFTTIESMTEPSPTASFEGYLGAATGSSDQGIATQTFWGVYPYDENNTCDGTGVTMTIPSAQKGVPGTFANNLNPSVANSPGLSLSFYNVGSWFMFSVVTEGITSVTFKGNNNEDLVGKIHVTMGTDTNGKPRPTAEVLDGGKVITMSPEDGGAFEVGKMYYMVLLPQTLSNGYTFTMYKGDTFAFRKITASKTFGISSYVPGRQIDNGLTWEQLYVDMGDGHFWATMNVGANSPEEYGDYFAWGETAPKASYTTGNYTATSFQDAATAQMGDLWSTPSDVEWQWLVDNCSWEWTDNYNSKGVAGYTVTSNQNSNSIFLPAGGSYVGDTYGDVNSWGYYWASSLHPNSSGWCLIMSPGSHLCDYNARSTGQSIRAVRGMSAPDQAFVELGPGIKWATMNLGATSETDHGDYFAWGETEPYYSSLDPRTWKAGKESGYDWASYTKYTTDGGNTLSKYVLNDSYGTVDGRTVLEAVDDAATAILGEDWRTPTRAEWSWLYSNCTWDYGEKNGVYGFTVTSNVSGYESNSIFIPMAGSGDGTNIYGGGERMIIYWTSSLEWDPWYPSTNTASLFWTTKPLPDGVAIAIGSDSYYRCKGYPIRPVCMPKTSVSGISLNTTSVNLTVGETSQLSATVTPSEATEKGYVWSTSDESVARVNTSGTVTAVGGGTATITATTVDGGFTASCEVTVLGYVEMDEGFKWATMNIGATSETDFGDYFAWGDPVPKVGTPAGYTWGTYKHMYPNMSDPYGINKYQVEDNQTMSMWYNGSTFTGDNKLTLDAEDDPATVIWGSKWRSPTKEEWARLADMDKFRWLWQDDYNNTGVSGILVTSKVPGYQGHSIFLPLAGAMNGSVPEYTTYGVYWSSTLFESLTMQARGLSFASGESYPDSSSRPERCLGLPVRAVLK